MNKRPLLIDCDPGVDDAQALMLAAGCGEFDIQAITAVHGNVSLESTARNALFLRDLLGLDCSVARGADRSLIMRLPGAEHVHGADGMAGFLYPDPAGDFDSRTAWELIWQEAQAQGGALEILALGPLTNIAIAILAHPQLPALVRKLVVMGGGTTKGNMSPYAEFNTWKDPHAMEIVLAAGFADITVADLDGCDTAAMTRQEADRLLDLPVGNSIAPLFNDIRTAGRDLFVNRAKTEDQKAWFREHVVAYDAVAAAVAACPELADTQDVYMFCECGSSLSAGQTIVDWTRRMGRASNVKLLRSVDRDRYVDLYFRAVAAYDGKGGAR